jgi:hypothetical protein
MEKHTIVWRGVAVEITFTPARFSTVDHIELRTDDKTPLPVTETGYRSNFLQIGHVAAHGGAVEFVTAWLDFEAARIDWKGAQLSLF